MILPNNILNPAGIAPRRVFFFVSLSLRGLARSRKAVAIRNILWGTDSHGCYAASE